MPEYVSLAQRLVFRCQDETCSHFGEPLSDGICPSQTAKKLRAELRKTKQAKDRIIFAYSAVKTAKYTAAQVNALATVETLQTIANNLDTEITRFEERICDLTHFLKTGKV